MSPFLNKDNLLKRSFYDFWRELLWVGLLSFVANLLMLTPTLYMLQIYDRVMLSESDLTLLFLTVIVVCLFFFMALAEWLRARLLVRAGLSMDEKLSPQVFKAAFESQLAGAQHKANEAFTHLTNIRQFFTGAGIIALFDAPWTPIYIGVIFLLHPYLGGLAIAFAIIQLLVAILSHRFTHGSTEVAAEAEVKSKQVLYAKLRNAESVEAMGMIVNLRERWLWAHTKAQSTAGFAAHQQKKFQSITKFMRYVMQSLTLGAAAILVIKGEISMGAMIAANVLMSRALQPLDQIVGSWRQAVQTKLAVFKLNALLNEFPEKSLVLNISTPKGEIRLNKLSAMATTKTQPILAELDAIFYPGQVTAIIGPSGSGKSTLARCLVGVWPNTSGQVLLDERPIEEWDREHLGQNIGYLPQDIELLDGTIAENISRFDGLDAEKIIEASMRAGIHEMVLRLPMGYDTAIGSISGILSNGQRQRLALARALYGSPQVVVLDEPNASLDEQGEQALLSAIQALKAQHKTVFMIVHRGDLLALADYTLVMDSGKIKHYGPRDEVIQAIKTS